MRALAGTLAAASLFLPCLATRAADDDAEATRTREGLTAFRAYLTKHHPDKKWQAGPARLDSAAVQAAYGKLRFYHVFSSPPLPPGANIKSVQEAYRNRVADIRTNYVSVAVRAWARGFMSRTRINNPCYTPACC